MNTDRFARLRIAALQRDTSLKGIRPKPGALLKALRGAYAKGLENGTLRTLEKNGRAVAAFFEYDDSASFPGVKVRALQVDCDVRDAFGRRWVGEELRRRRKDFHDRTVFFLPASYRKLLPLFQANGFAIESLVLFGKTREALAGIRKLRPPEDLAHLGLEIRKLRRSDIPAVLRLHKSEFSRNPQYGWFCTSRAFLDGTRAELRSELKSPNHSNYVICRGAKVLGCFSATAGAPSAFGLSSGLSLVFDKSIQGLGIAKTAYLVLLKDLARKKIGVFRGGTSQKAVMGLGKVMNRRVSVYIIRHHRGYFSAKHFKY